MRGKIGGALPLQTTPPGANGPLDRGILVPGTQGHAGTMNGNTVSRRMPWPSAKYRFPKALEAV